MTSSQNCKELIISAKGDIEFWTRKKIAIWVGMKGRVASNGN